MSDFPQSLLLAFDAPAAQSAGFTWGDMIPLALMFFIAWIFILKPNADQQRDHEALMTSLSKDDKVVTKSGIHGKVVRVEENTVLLEVSDKVRMMFDKQAIARRADIPVPANG